MSIWDSIPRASQRTFRWKRIGAFLQTTAGNTLLTFFLTGVIAAAITAFFQTLSKKNELAITANRETAVARLATIADAYQRASRIVAASDDLLASTGPTFDTSQRDEQVKKIMDEQSVAIRDAFSREQNEWQARHLAILYLVRYYFPAERARSAWRQVDADIFGYARCARDESIQHPRVKDPFCVCLKNRTKALTSLDHFAVVIERND